MHLAEMHEDQQAQHVNAPEDERSNALNDALDDIIKKFGPDAVKRGRK